MKKVINSTTRGIVLLLALVGVVLTSSCSKGGEQKPITPVETFDPTQLLGTWGFTKVVLVNSDSTVTHPLGYKGNEDFLVCFTSITFTTAPTATVRGTGSTPLNNGQDLGPFQWTIDSNKVITFYYDFGPTGSDSQQATVKVVDQSTLVLLFKNVMYGGISFASNQNYSK